MSKSNSEEQQRSMPFAFPSPMHEPPTPMTQFIEVSLC